MKELNLVPLDAELIPEDLQGLIASLGEVGFLGKAIGDPEETAYRTGPRFFEFVEFESSHPIIHLKNVNGELVPSEVTDSRDECTISFEEVGDSPEFLGGAPTEAPLCGKCGHVEEEWPDMISDWYPRKLEHRWICPNCRAVQRVYDMDWQDCASFGRFRISIGSIAFREAAPTQNLFDELLRVTGFPWKHFYFDDNPTGIQWD